MDSVATISAVSIFGNVTCAGGMRMLWHEKERWQGIRHFYDGDEDTQHSRISYIADNARERVNFRVCILNLHLQR